MIIDLAVWDRERVERYDLNAGDVEGLRWSYISPGGSGSCSFLVRRDPFWEYPDLAIGNVVELSHEGDRIWTGRISVIYPSIENEPHVAVECDGITEILRRTYCQIGIAEGVETSVWIRKILIPRFPFLEGDLRDKDAKMPLLPEGDYWGKYLDEGVKHNGWHWEVTPDGKFDWRPVTFEDAPGYIIERGDYSARPGFELDWIRNEVWAKYTNMDGVQQVISSGRDVESEKRYGPRDVIISLSGKMPALTARHAATVYREAHAWPMPAAAVEARRVLDRDTGEEVPLYRVRAGRMAEFKGYMDANYPAETNRLLMSFPLAMVEFEYGNPVITLSPGNPAWTLDVMLASLERANAGR